MDSASSIISKLLPITFTLLLNVTGPSNWERICLDFPPSILSLSLTVISSKIELNLEGSSPVSVGTGASKVFSYPVAEVTLLLPIKKSPSLFMPV